MDRTTLAILIHELRNQCMYTETAFRVFNQSLEQKAGSAVFFAAQSTLLSASQIAGMIWPPRARAKKRGEAFREVVQLPEKHPLNDKRLIALWEHADEKLEDWIGRTKGQRIVFDHLGSITAFDNPQIPEGNIYRLYDPTSMVFYFRGDGFKMQTIANAVSDIYSRVNALHRQFFPEQQPAAQPESPPPAAATKAPADTAKTTGKQVKVKPASQRRAKKDKALSKKKAPGRKNAAAKKEAAPARKKSKPKAKGGKARKTK